MKLTHAKSLSPIATVLALCLVVVSQAQAKTINVNCGKKSLHAAVSSANSGDTINVSGTCNETVTVNKRGFTLNGGGTAVMEGAGLGSVPGFRVQAINVVIDGFTIQNYAGHAGVQVRRGGAAVIRSNAITGNLWGILVNQNGYAVIGGSGNHTLPGDPGSVGNEINSNGTGIIIRQASSADIFHNLIENNTSNGIHLNQGGTADIDGNEITGHTMDATRSGINVFMNASVRLSGDPGHSEPNAINGNSIGVRCSLGGALRGNSPDFTGGNTVANTSISSSCPVSSTLGF